jgi:hypothetical protein
VVRRVIHRDAPWFPPIAPSSPLPDDQTVSKPEARLIGIVPADSIVWVVWSGVSTNWRRGIGRVRGERQMQWMVTQPNVVFDTYVEAFSAEAGQLLASLRVDEQILTVDASGGIVRSRVSRTGDEWLVTSRFRISSTSRRN